MANNIRDDERASKRLLHFGDAAESRAMRAMGRNESQKGRLVKKLKFHSVRFIEFAGFFQKTRITTLSVG
jgi:hypothetical protein